MTTEPYVTADDIAAHLKITRRQVLEMSRRGIIPGHPLGIGASRRIWRYKVGEVETAIASGSRELFGLLNTHDLADHPARRTMLVGSPRSQKGKL
jgi:hypothetical protein